jgi:hypothetical protein
MCTVQMGSAHCASQTSPARGSRLAWPFGPRPKSRRALAATASWQRSSWLRPAGVDGRWGGRWLEHKEVAGDPLEVGEGLVGAHPGLSTVVQLSGEKPATRAGTGGHRWWAPHQSRAHGGGRRGSIWPEAAVHMEEFVAARVEGIWQRRHGPEVDGTGSGLEKLRWTGGQLLAVVTRPGAHRSGPVTERHPEQRNRTASSSSVLGGRRLPAW